MSNVYRSVNTFDTWNACSRSFRLVPALDNVFLRSCTRIRYIRGAARVQQRGKNTRSLRSIRRPAERACVTRRIERKATAFPFSVFSPLFSCLPRISAKRREETCGFRAGFHFPWLMFRKPLSSACLSLEALETRAAREVRGIGKCVWKTRTRTRTGRGSCGGALSSSRPAR